MTLFATADVPTMLLMILVISGAMAVAVASVSLGMPARDGLRRWGWAMALNTVAFLAFGASASATTNAAWWLVLGNGLQSASLVMGQNAVVMFVGAPWKRRWAWGMAAIVLLISTLWRDDAGWRVPQVDGCLLLQALGLTRLTLYRQATGSPAPSGGRGRWLMAGGVLLLALIYGERIGLAMMERIQDLGLTHNGLPQTLSYMLGLIGLVFSTLGFVLMHKERAESLLHRLAMEDALTELANRRCVMAMLEQALAHAARVNEPVSVVMLDIDWFKKVNDTFGHPVGDQVLQAVARTLREHIRKQDLVGRYGGEEFLLVLPNTPAAGAWHVAEALREQLASAPLVCGDLQVPITISLGVHTRTPTQGAQEWSAMVGAADQALYHAKQNGRNQTQVEPA